MVDLNKLTTKISLLSPRVKQGFCEKTTLVDNQIYYFREISSVY